MDGFIICFKNYLVALQNEKKNSFELQVFQNGSTYWSEIYFQQTAPDVFNSHFQNKIPKIYFIIFRNFKINVSSAANEVSAKRILSEELRK